MHILEARIDNYYINETDEIFWEKWYSLNPEGFDYTGYDNEYSLEFEDFEDSFVSSYSLTTDCEDRAEIFSRLFTYDENELPYWFKYGNKLSVKAIFLCEAIRAAYPSMKNLPAQQWEKPIRQYLEYLK